MTLCVPVKCIISLTGEIWPLEKTLGPWLWFGVSVAFFCSDAPFLIAFHAKDARSVRHESRLEPNIGHYCGSLAFVPGYLQESRTHLFFCLVLFFHDNLNMVFSLIFVCVLSLEESTTVWALACFLRPVWCNTLSRLCARASVRTFFLDLRTLFMLYIYEEE